MLKSKRQKKNIEESCVLCGHLKKSFKTEYMPKFIFEIFQGWQERVLQLFSFFSQNN